MVIKDKTIKISAELKVIVSAEFYDDEASEETLRYCVEQDLEDAGFDVEVRLLKKHVYCKDCKYYDNHMKKCLLHYIDAIEDDWFCASGEKKE